MNEKLLKIYLEDHFAAATAGVELARRLSGQNADRDDGGELARICAEIEEDRERLEDVMERFEIAPARVKQGFAWAGEKLGRLKLNGQLTGYSPLSRLIEIEGLAIGVAGKLELWRSLRVAADGDSRLQGVDLKALIRRASKQRDRLEELHDEAAREALAGAAESART